jgi:serine/threonine protein phosphatase PrpC
VGLITRVVSKSDVGRARQRNEDSVRIDALLGIAVVADGMGGHPAGDQASQIVADEVFARLKGFLTPDSNGRISTSDVGRRMAEAVKKADQTVRSAGREDRTLEGMGTTLTALVIEPRNEHYVIAHVGDSRAYRFRGGRLDLLTRDHTWVWEQVEAGRITKEQAWSHPHGNIITQAIGVDAPAEPDVIESLAMAGDVFLLCSDGLSGMIRDARIEELIAAHIGAGLEAVADALVQAANAEGGKDNITVALLAVEDE